MEALEDSNSWIQVQGVLAVDYSLSFSWYVWVFKHNLSEIFSHVMLFHSVVFRTVLSVYVAALDGRIVSALVSVIFFYCKSFAS